MLVYSVPPEVIDQLTPQLTTSTLIVDEFLRKNPLKTDETIIDIGCQTGRLTEYISQLLPDVHISGIENNSNLINYAKAHHNASNIVYHLKDLITYEPSLRKSAGLIICSWVIHDLLAEQQKAFTNNLYQYLKKDGQLLVLFPVTGLALTRAIQAVITSDKWQACFLGFENDRAVFTPEQYERLLRNTGFHNQQISIREVKFLFQDKKELINYLTTSLSRYSSCLSEPEQYEDFIFDVTEQYLEKTDSANQEIPYNFRIIAAIAKKPALTLLLSQQGSTPVITGGVNGQAKVVEDHHPGNCFSK